MKLPAPVPTIRIIPLVLVAVLFMALMSTTAYAEPNLPAPDDAPLPEPYVPPLNPPPEGAPRPLLTAAIPEVVSDPLLDMKVLVIDRVGEADGVLATATAYLDILGVPYDLLDTTQPAPGGLIEEDDLWDGSRRGYYYAIFVTTSNVWYALSAEEKGILEEYEREFNVRQVTWYAYPSAVDYGLDFTRVVAEASGDVPLDTTLTSAGQAIFSYLNTSSPVTIDGSGMYGYMASPAAGADTTPLLIDAAGDTMLAVFRPGDGREQMVMSMGSFYPAIPPQYVHARTLPYGIINWATRGLFLGQRHVAFSPQPDDILGEGDTWDVDTHWYIYDTGYRNLPSDMDNLVAWKNTFRTTPNASGFLIEMPFNGEASFLDRDEGTVLPGTLTARLMALEGEFAWLNHTYSHRDLDIDETPYPGYAISYNEIHQNTLMAANLGFSDYSNATLLTGDYSGIEPPNPDLANAAYDLGVRYMAVNASLSGFSNPTPNTGILHPTRPEILLVPRYANNIFYAATTPEQETDLYNYIYCPGYASDPDNTPLCYDYSTILESITNQALGFMLDFSTNATMFHMNNLGDYGGGRTLMIDFVESLYGKYNALYGDDVPVLSLRTQDIGALMRERMAYNESGVSAQLACGDEITVFTEHAASIPVTGVDTGANVETYAGQMISTLSMGDGDTLLIPGKPASIPAAISDLAGVRSGQDLTLTWSPVAQDTNGEALTPLLYRVYARVDDTDFTPTPADLLAEVSDPTFVHTLEAGDTNTYIYVVTTVGDNCWKMESAGSNRVDSNGDPSAIALSAISAVSEHMPTAWVVLFTFFVLCACSLWVLGKETKRV